MSWKVYDKTGNTVRCTLKSLEYNGTWMGACFVTSTLKSAVPILFEIGDYVMYRGEKFEINYDPTALKKAARKTSGEAFVYDNVKFNGAGDELTRCDFLDYVKSDNQIHFTSLPKFSFFASSIQDLADRVQVNLDRIYTGVQKWTVVVHPEYVSTTNVNIDVNNIKVWGALELFNSKFGANFIIRGRTITIGTAGIAADNIFRYGRGNGLYEIQRTADADQQIITRLRAYGSTRNMPNRYYNKVSNSSLANYLPNNMAVENLMLPDFPKTTLDPYIDSKNIAVLGVREGSVYFDGTGDLEEICPSMEGMTAKQLEDAGIHVSLDAGDNGNLDEVFDAEQLTDDGTMDNLKDGEDIPPFTITLKDIGFDINDYLTSETATISMKNGMCGGRDFEITKCEKKGNKYILTCNRIYDEGLKLYFPYKDYNIRGGDKFVLLYIDMPDVYIQAASQRLLAAAKKYLAKNDYVRYSYEPKVDDIFMARQHDEAIARGEVSIHDTLKEGDLMLFTDTDLGIDGSIIIDTLIIKEGEGIIPQYTITLKDEKTVGTLEKIQNQIDSIVSGGQGSGGYNSNQIKSLIKSFGSNFFLSKLISDTANGLITFLKGLLIGRNGSGITVLENGMSQAVVDYLYVKVKAVFDELEVKKKTYVGGEQVISHAGMKCNRVDELDDVYRCYFKEEEDGIEIENQFTPGSLAIAQECNIKAGVSHHVGNRHYWRLVTAVGENYIDLSKTVCDPNVENDVPVAGDDIVGLGHKTDITRQAAIILSSVNEVSPSIIMYQGINDFTLTGKDVISFDFDKSTGKVRMKVYGNTYIGDKDRTTYMEYTQDKGVDIKGMFHIEQGSTGWRNMEGLPDEIQAAADLAQEAKDAIDNAAVGSVNLLRNSGFTGDYESEKLSSDTQLSADTELYSKQLKYWTGVATVSADSAAGSGYSASIGSLSQSVSLIKNENYVISFKAKGTSVAVSCGDFSTTQPLASDYQRYTFKFAFNGTGIFMLSSTATICDLQLERGTIATDWKPSILDNDKATAGFQSINYIASAIKDGSVDILGGLILANMIQLGNYKNGKLQKVTAGVSGIYNDDDDVAFWAGGTLQQAILTVMRFRNDPNYQPTDEEWENMANFVVAHGGDVFLRGYIYALGGKFRGVVEALGGFFRGKVETSVDGKRIVIDPDKNTLEMYTTEGHATLILRFDTSSDGWEYGDLILRKYVGDQLIQETTVYPERIRIQNHVENTDIILTPNNVSFYGSKGETLLVGMKPVYDGGAVSKYVANIECSNWPSKDNVSSGQVYVEYETLEGIVTNGVLKVRK